MKLKIEKVPETGQMRLTVIYSASKAPLVIEGEQLDGLIEIIDMSQKADRFTLEVEMK